MSQIQVELQDSMGDDASIANAAWTSTYNKDKREGKYDDKDKVYDLVMRLARDGHSVPFESVVFRFWMRIPIFTDRQVMTHRIASHNGLSGRYRTVPEDYLTLPTDVLHIIQGTPIESEYDELMIRQHQCYSRWLGLLRDAEKRGAIVNAQYKRAREVLRGILGTSFMTERTTVLNLRSFSNFQRLRNSDHAQPEIREVATQMLDLVIKADICPVAMTALASVDWRI